VKTVVPVGVVDPDGTVVDALVAVLLLSPPPLKITMPTTTAAMTAP